MSSRLKSILLGSAVALSFAFHGADRALASTSQPSGINLGATSFDDAFPAPLTFVYEQYFQYLHFNAINDDRGKAIGKPVFNNQSINAVVSLNQFVWNTPVHIAGAQLGTDLLLPLINLSSHSSQPSIVNLKANGFGVGDLTFGLFLQGSPITVGGRPVFSQRFEFDAVAPIGSYNRNKDINQSSGFWSINPYYTVTVLPTANTEISTRFNYLDNFRNNKPAASTPVPAGSSYQAGQAGWVNFTAAYIIKPGFEIGVNGYYFKQFTDDQANGVAQRGAETTNLSVGPGVFYAVSQNNLLFANAYLPVIEKNTTNGFHLVFRWVHFF